MNYLLSKEMYGKPWFVDANSLPGLMGTLNAIRNGIALEIPEIKLNTPEILTVKNDTRIISRPFGNRWVDGELENGDEFEGIGLININGPITRTGGASSRGMVEVSEMMLAMNNDKRMVGFIILADSGGGASSAVQLMVDTINKVKETKPVYSLIPKGGMAASAMYGIISPTKIYSEDVMNIVGSAGTMIQFEGVKANTETPDGVKNIRLYATKSTQKNKGFEEALNNDNYEVLINDLLDPVNENFLSMLLANRPQLEGTNYDNGHTLFSKDAVGTFIDGIASFNEVVDMVMGDYRQMNSINNNNNSNQNLNSKKMTRDELRNSHPEVFNSIFQEGVTAEQERVASWMNYQTADPKAVAEGIASGKDISPSQREGLLIKMHSATNLQALQDDNAPSVATGAANVSEEAKEKEEVEKLNNEWADAAKKI